MKTDGIELPIELLVNLSMSLHSTITKHKLALTYKQCYGTKILDTKCTNADSPSLYLTVHKYQLPPSSKTQSMNLFMEYEELFHGTPGLGILTHDISIYRKELITIIENPQDA